MQRSKISRLFICITIVVCLVFFILLPVLSVFSKAVINSSDRFDFSGLLSDINQQDNLETIGNSLLLGFLVSLVSTIIATPLAFILTKTRIGNKKWLDIILLIPFMTPPYISSMGWISFLQKKGYFQQLFPSTGSFSENFFSLFGLVMIMSFHVFPFLLTIIKNAIYGINQSLEESAKISGGGFFYRLKRIILPLLSGNYAIGILLVFVKTLSEYGTPATFGSRIKFHVFTTQIHNYVSISPIDFQTAASLSSVLVVICLVFWFIQNIITEKRTYKLIGGKGTKSGKVKNPVIIALSVIYICMIICLSIGIPYFSIIASSLIKLRSKGLVWSNLSFDNYSLLFSQKKALGAIETSFIMAVISATIASIIGFIIVISIRKMKKMKKPILAIATLPEMIPNIILVIGLMIFWNMLYKVIPVYNTTIFMVICYVVMFLPYGIQYSTSSIMQVSDSLVDASHICGGNAFYTNRRVMFPLVFKGILAGWMMIFIIVFRELVASSLIVPSGTMTISTYIMNQFEQGEVGLGMAMSLICVLISTTSLIILNIFTSRGKDDKSTNKKKTKTI